MPWKDADPGIPEVGDAKKRLAELKRNTFVDKNDHKNKKKDGRYLLNDEILKMLKRRQKENGKSELIFIRYEGQNPKPITEKWIQRKWREIKEEANKMLEKKGTDLRIQDDLRFYDLKATKLSRVGAAGANEYLLQTISNHANPASLKRYVRNKALEGATLEYLNGNRKNGVKNRSKK